MSAAAVPGARRNLTSFLRRTGVRLALVQALVLISALGIAGYLSQASSSLIARHAVETRVLGEMASMKAELVQRGAAHLPHTVAKRSRLWHGFEYRLAGPDGRWRAGELPAGGRARGWSTVIDRHSRAPHRILAYGSPLPDGSTLWVGQDLTADVEQAAIVTRTLIWCGAAGVLAGLIASYLFMGSAWRRVSALARAAHEASTGDLGVRVRTRQGGPRDDIDDLGVAFNTMLAEIVALMGQAREVSTAIAHDLRTPLTRVRQRLERLRRAAVDAPDLLKQMEQIDLDLEELLRSFDAMLRLAEIENATDAGVGPVDIGDVAARVAEAYRPDIEESGRQLCTRLEPVSIRADRQLISQAVANLLDNAVRHTPEGTPIEIGVERRAEGAALFVLDHGPGVPADQRAAVLQRFRRLDRSRAGSGSGLGLAIVAAIARRHGAALELADAGPGLKVELTFPEA